jgi:hypothetical protein
MAQASLASGGPTGAGASVSDGGGGDSDIGSASSGIEFDAKPSVDAQADGDGGAVSPVVPGAPVAEPFKFGRRQWPSQERAEQEFLATVGRLQASERRAAERERELETLRMAVQRGQVGAAGAPGETGSSAGAAVEEAAAAILDPDSLDWELITDAMKERGPEVGLYLFAQKLSQALGKGFDARLKGVTEQLSGYEQGSRLAHQASELWDGAVMAAGEDGALYFPELSDPQSLSTAMAIWREITDGMPPEVAIHPRMARMAILEMRAMQGAEGESAEGNGTGSGSAGAGPAVDPGQVAAGAVRRAAQAAGARGVLPPGRGTQPGRREAPETEESRIKRTLMTSGQEVGQLCFRR